MAIVRSEKRHFWVKKPWLSVGAPPQPLPTLEKAVRQKPDGFEKSPSYGAQISAA
jgi:hypothetical protein